MGTWASAASATLSRPFARPRILHTREEIKQVTGAPVRIAPERRSAERHGPELDRRMDKGPYALCMRGQRRDARSLLSNSIETSAELFHLYFSPGRIRFRRCRLKLRYIAPDDSRSSRSAPLPLYLVPPPVLCPITLTDRGFPLRNCLIF